MREPEDVIGFVPIFKPEPGSVQTAAMIHCTICGVTVGGMGGPRSGALCIPCTSATIAGRSTINEVR